MQRLYQARSGAMGGGQGISGRVTAPAGRRQAAADSESHRYTDRQDRMESDAAGAGRILGRNVEHGNGSGDLRRGRRRADGGRRGDRQTAVELPDQPDVEGVADDLPVRREAIRRSEEHTSELQYRQKL